MDIQPIQRILFNVNKLSIRNGLMPTLLSLYSNYFTVCIETKTYREIYKSNYNKSHALIDLKSSNLLIAGSFEYHLLPRIKSIHPIHTVKEHTISLPSSELTTEALNKVKTMFTG